MPSIAFPQLAPAPAARYDMAALVQNQRGSSECILLDTAHDMKVERRQTAALVLAVFVVAVSACQVDETVSALKYWWAVKHASSADFLVSHWATLYTWESALFAPFWFAVSASAFFFVRRWPTLALSISAACMIAAPISCAYAPSLDKRSRSPFGFEELPFADAE